MSACIGPKGEYSDHTYENWICTNCRAADPAEMTNILPWPLATDPAAVWAHGHESGFWNGKAAGDANVNPGPVGADHAKANNPFGPESLLQVRAGDLNLTQHLCKRVTVTGGGATMTGVLVSVHHECDLIDDSRMFADPGDPNIVPGRSYTTVKLIPDLQMTLNSDSPVEVHP